MSKSQASQRGSRLVRILEEVRDVRSPNVSGEFVKAVGELEERNQFAEDRKSTLKELRKALESEVRRVSVEEST